MKGNKSYNAGDLIIPLFSIAFGIYYISTIVGIPRIAMMFGGSLSVISIVLSIAVIIVIFRNGVLKKGKIEISSIGNFTKVAVLVGLVVLYIELTRYIGYPVTSFLFVATVMRILGVKRIATLLLSALIVTTIGYVLFVLFLGVRLPLDSITLALKNLVR